MEINSAVFVTSLPKYCSFPGKGLPQIAVAGKSNVGKSSLINALCRRKNLAKTSGTPGKTRLINVFLLNETLHLIDLPGYGYAKVSKSEKERWGAMMEEYFSQSQDLKVMLQLVDIRHEPTRDDVQMVNFLRDSGIPFVVAATKADKLSKAQRQRAVHLVARTLAVQPWEIIPWSSETGEGRDQLLKALQEHI
jgi:GTP-binding protein